MFRLTSLAVTSFDPNRDDFYGGIAHATLPCDEYDLGQGVMLARTYGHLMSPLLMAFAPAPKGGPHPTPFAAVRGSGGVDMQMHVFIPKSFSQKDWFDRLNTAWWITSLLRMRLSPAVALPVIADRPFASAPANWQDVQIIAIESSPRRVLAVTEHRGELTMDDLLWLRDHWIKGGRLMNAEPAFNAAYQAFDFSSHAGSVGLSLLTVWGALEQLFAHAKQELRFRVSTSIACYLQEHGPERLSLQKRVQKLYDARSTAAHTTVKVEHQELVESYAILRRCLIKMIETGVVPSRAELEQRMFC